MNSLQSCSFCGKVPDDHVQVFRPESEPLDSPVAICEECVLTCAKAVDVEHRLSERPASKPNGDAVPESERPAREATWHAFQLGTLSLEWRSEPAVLVSVRRRDDHDRLVVESFGPSTEPTVDDAETVAEDHWSALHD